ncbi:MAG: hypothetical protein ACYS6W_09290 [Planctomycetota bacterium]
MKRYLILIGAVLVVLALAWSAFAQREGAAGEGRAARGRAGALSAEERAKMRERFQNMSEEEREKFRAQMRERFGSGRRGLGREDQLKAIKAIEAQLAKLKAGIEAQGTERRSFRDLPEEERAKLRDQFTKAREERQKALKAIIAQVARLQGQRQPAAEGEEFILVNTAQLKEIGKLAVKEKAKETAQRLERLGRGRMGFRGGRSAAPRPGRTTDRPSPGGARRQRGRGGSEMEER